jgi:hypothetical protein
MTGEGSVVTGEGLECASKSGYSMGTGGRLQVQRQRGSPRQSGRSLCEGKENRENVPAPLGPRKPAAAAAAAAAAASEGTINRLRVRLAEADQLRRLSEARACKCEAALAAMQSEYDELRETALRFEESSEQLLESNLALQRLVQVQEECAWSGHEPGLRAGWCDRDSEVQVTSLH